MTTSSFSVAAQLRSLPQPRQGRSRTLADVDDHLARLEAARKSQLDALPPVPQTVVAAAHRSTVAWILDQVRTARQRLSEGRYGLCTRCGTSIDPERLDLQPWLLTCPGCAPPERPGLSLVPTTGR